MDFTPLLNLPPTEGWRRLDLCLEDFRVAPSSKEERCRKSSVA
jgi:hypothetical protein